MWFSKEGAFDRGGKPPFEDQRVRWHVGWFNETLDRFLAEHTGNVTFLHVDCDLYSSASYVLQRLAPRLTPGAVIVFDELMSFPDYAEGEMRAFLELLRATGRGVLALGHTAERWGVLSTPEAIQFAMYKNNRNNGQQAVFQIL